MLVKAMPLSHNRYWAIMAIIEAITACLRSGMEFHKDREGVLAFPVWRDV